MLSRRIKKICLGLASSITTIALEVAFIPSCKTSNKSENEFEFQTDSEEVYEFYQKKVDRNNKAVIKQVKKLTKDIFFVYNFFLNGLLRKDETLNNASEIFDEFSWFYQKLSQQYNINFNNIVNIFKKNSNAIIFLNKIKTLNENIFKQTKALFTDLIKTMKLKDNISVISEIHQLNKDIFSDYLSNLFVIIEETNQDSDNELIILDWEKEFDSLYYNNSSNVNDFVWDLEQINENLQVNFYDLIIDYKNIVNNIFDYYLVNLYGIINNSEKCSFNDTVILFKEFNKDSTKLFNKAFNTINIEGFVDSEYQLIKKINHFNQEIIKQFQFFEDIIDQSKTGGIAKILIGFEPLINKIKFNYLTDLNNLIKEYQYENIDLLIDKIEVFSDSSFNELDKKIDDIFKKPQKYQNHDIFDDHISSLIKNDINKTIKKLRKFFNENYDWNLSFANNGQDVLDLINSKLKKILTFEEYQVIKIKFFDEKLLNENLDESDLMLQLSIEFNNKLIDGIFFINLINIKN